MANQAPDDQLIDTITLSSFEEDSQSSPNNDIIILSSYEESQDVHLMNVDSQASLTPPLSPPIPVLQPVQSYVYHVIKSRCSKSKVYKQDYIDEMYEAFGLPESRKSQSTKMFDHESFVSVFNLETKNALYVAECSTNDLLKARYGRFKLPRRTGQKTSYYQFYKEKNLPLCHQSKSEDFEGSGYHRGHLVPAINYSCCEEHYLATWNLAVISPQRRSVNLGLWKSLETYVR